MIDFAGQVCAWANRATSLWQFNLPAAAGPKRVLVLQCHPVAESFGASCARAAVAGLQAGGHDVRLRTLYDLGPTSTEAGALDGHAYLGRDFPPALRANERRGYYEIAATTTDRAETLAPEGGAPEGGTFPPSGMACPAANLPPEVEAAVADLRWAQGLVRWIYLGTARRGGEVLHPLLCIRAATAAISFI